MRNKILTFYIVYGLVIVFLLFTSCGYLENPHDNPFDPEYTGSSSPPVNGNGTDTISIENLLSGDIISGELTITAETLNNGNISYVEFYIDGDWKETVDSVPYKFTWDTTIFSDGEHNIEVIGYNISSIQIANYAIKVIIDNAIFGTGRFGYARFKEKIN